MTDYMEITEAFNQARTAPDVTDRATGLEEADRIGGVAMVRERLQGQGAEFCIDCDEEIPDARRKAYPSAVCCVECQGIRDKMEARRRG